MTIADWLLNWLFQYSLHGIWLTKEQHQLSLMNKLPRNFNAKFWVVRTILTVAEQRANDWFFISILTLDSANNSTQSQLSTFDWVMKNQQSRSTPARPIRIKLNAIPDNRAWGAPIGWATWRHQDCGIESRRNSTTIFSSHLFRIHRQCWTRTLL